MDEVSRVQVDRENKEIFNQTKKAKLGDIQTEINKLQQEAQKLLKELEDVAK